MAESGSSAEPTTTSGSSSSQSQSIPSSASLESASTAPTLPTQDAVDGANLSDDEEDASTVSSWGRLFPLSAGFNLTELREKNDYEFGRGSNNDIVYEARNFTKNTSYQSISTKHMKIYRELTSDEKISTVFLTDLSSNGTFINGEKIGKNKTQVLNNEDEISLPLRMSKAYVFQDCTGRAHEQQDAFPEELKCKYIISRTLGRGACGEVKLAFSKGSAIERFAVKIISKKKFSVGPRQTGLKDEVMILKAIDHPCIISVKDMIETDDALYIVLELVEGGELFDRVHKVKRFPEKTAKLLFYQMLDAVKYLHKRGVTHRDLKPENVLLASDQRETLIKITDFGLSKMIGEQSFMKTLCGTPSYLAPEVLLTAGMGRYSKAVDCWSLGVILFICLGGYPPFSDESKTHTLHDQVTRGLYDFPDELWNTVSRDAIDLIKKLLTVNPKKRISVSDALEHPWMKDDEICQKAQALMFPAQDMLPPNQPVKRRYPSDETSNELDNKRLHSDVEDTGSSESR